MAPTALYTVARHSSPISRVHYNIRYVLLIQLLCILYTSNVSIYIYRCYTHTHTDTRIDRVIITIDPLAMFVFIPCTRFVHPPRTSAVRVCGVFRLFHRRPPRVSPYNNTLIYPSRRRFLGVLTCIEFYIILYVRIIIRVYKFSRRSARTRTGSRL